MADLYFKIIADTKELDEAYKKMEQTDKLADQITKKLSASHPGSKEFNALNKQLADLNKQYEAMVKRVAELEAKLSENANKTVKTVTTSTNTEVQAYESVIKAIQDVLGTRNQNLALLAKEEIILKQVSTERRTLEQLEKNGAISAKDAATQRAALLDREIQHKQAISELRIALSSETKELQAADSSMKQMSLSLGRMREAYRQMTAAERESPFGQQLQKDIQDLNQKMITLDATLGNHQRKVGNYASTWNGLSMQVQQVAREMPSMAVGMSTFILAISNNLPMLADELKKASVEYKAFQAAVKSGATDIPKVAPVWKQLASSIFSWQTALVVAITLITVYWKDIANFTKGLFGANQAQQALNDSMTDFNTILAKETQNLRIVFSAIDRTKEGTEGRKKAIDAINTAYGKYLPNLLSEKSSLMEINTAYQLVNKSLRENAALKAQGNAIDKVLEKAIKVQSEALTEMREIATEKLGESKSGGIMDIVSNLTEDFRTAGQSWKKAWQGVSAKIQSEIGNKKLGSSFFEELEDYVKSVYKSEKQISDIQKQFNPFFNKAEADKALVKNKEYYESMKQQAESVLESIDAEQKKSLDAGTTTGIDSAIVEKYKKAKTAIDEATEALKAYNSYDKKLAEAAKAATGTNRINSLLSKEDSERIKQEKDLQYRIEQAKVDAMADGWKKTKAQMDLNHQKELSELEMQQNEYLRKVVEYEQKKFEADPKNKGRVFDSSTIELSDEEQALFDKLQKELEKKQLEDGKRFSIDLKRQQSDMSNHFASELDKQLNEIDRYYEDALKKAEGYQGQIDQLTQNRTRERNNAINQDQLNKNSFNQEIATGNVDLKYSGTGMIETAEREKTEILKKYAEERIKMLEKIGDEQSRMEILSLNQAAEGYNKVLSKPKSVKQLFDEKIFKAVENHFKNTSETAEEAEEKTSKFFQAFSTAGQIASDVVGGLKGAFGGMSEELDMALDAVGNIAQGFAEGGLIGGISAAAGQAISVIGKLLTAKKEVDKSMIEGYKAYIDVMNQIITKQKESLKLLGGTELNNTIKKTFDNIQKEIAAARKLMNETLNSGAGLFSHSEGYKVKEMLNGYRRELAGVGISLEQLGGRADLSILPVEKLVRLQEELPEVWARLPEKIREYLNQIIDSKEQMEKLNQQLQDMLLGFSADDITSAIVDSLTDPAIDNAMGDLSGKMDEFISGIVKNIIVKMALTEPITKAVNEMMKGIATYDKDRYITGFKDVDKIEANVLARFKETVMGIAEGFDKTWKELSEQFSLEGINLNQSTKIDWTGGITSDSISDAILDGLQSGKSGIKDFASSFEDMMKTAVLNSLKTKYLEGPLKEFQKKFAELSESGGQLTEAEIEELRGMYADILSGAKDQFDAMKDISGLDFTMDSDNTLKGAFAKVSQESITLLAGQFGAMRVDTGAIKDNTEYIKNIQAQGWNDVRAIKDLTVKVEQNTNRIAGITENLGNAINEMSKDTRRSADALDGGTINAKVKM